MSYKTVIVMGISPDGVVSALVKTIKKTEVNQ